MGYDGLTNEEAMKKWYEIGTLNNLWYNTPVREEEDKNVGEV